MPITKLTGKDIPFEWGPAQREAQDKIIMLITNVLVLVKPDPSRQFELEVDASQIGTGAIFFFFFFFFFVIHLCASRGTEPHVALQRCT